MEYKDYYKIMGVTHDATPDDIKRAYRKLARKYHPDVSKASDAETRFKELGEAYEVLKDPQKRQAYDQLGQNWKQGEDFQPPPDWSHGFDFSGGSFTGAHSRRFSDFFESLFGNFNQRAGRTRTEFSMRGEDLKFRLRIRLEDAYHGTTSKVNLRMPQLDPGGQTVEQTRTLNVHIPVGIRRGQSIRLEGQGGRGSGNGLAGDLYLEIDFESHPLFEDNGRDILLKLPITPWEAALGTKVDVPTLGGRVAMKIPPNSASGGKLRLKGRGLPGNPPGDQLVMLTIVTPPANSTSAKNAYQRFAEAVPFNPRKKLEAWK